MTLKVLFNPNSMSIEEANAMLAKGHEPLDPSLWVRGPGLTQPTTQPTTRDVVRYPLFCVDTGVDCEHRYVGPFDTEAEAETELLALHERKDLVKDEGRVRRCRRLLVSEAVEGGVDYCGFDEIVDDTEDSLRENFTPKAGEGAWGDWTEDLVGAGPSAEEALEELRAQFNAWTDKHIVVDLFVCEGDE